MKYTSSKTGVIETELQKNKQNNTKLTPSSRVILNRVILLSVIEKRNMERND